MEGDAPFNVYLGGKSTSQNQLLSPAKSGQSVPVHTSDSGQALGCTGQRFTLTRGHKPHWLFLPAGDFL